MTKNACLHHAKWIHNFSFHDAHLTFTAIKIQTRRARLYEMGGSQQLKMFVVFVTHSNISQLYCQWHGMFSSFKTHFVSSFVFLDPLQLMSCVHRNKFQDFIWKWAPLKDLSWKFVFKSNLYVTLTNVQLDERLQKSLHTYIKEKCRVYFWYCKFPFKNFNHEKPQSHFSLLTPVQ